MFPQKTNPKAPEYPYIDSHMSLLEDMGALARSYNQRLIFFHPHHHNIVGSTHPNFLAAIIADFGYYAAMIDLINCDRHFVIVINGGGLYGDKAATLQRWARNYTEAPDFIRKRLVLENCERSFSIEDCLKISGMCGVPVVFDTHNYKLYNSMHPNEVAEPPAAYVERILATWGDIKPMFHVSEQGIGRPGNHSDYIAELPQYLLEIPERYGVEIDVMIEAKFKELAIFRLYEKYPQLNCASSGLVPKGLTVPKPSVPRSLVVKNKKAQKSPKKELSAGAKNLRKIRMVAAKHSAKTKRVVPMLPMIKKDLPISPPCNGAVASTVAAAAGAAVEGKATLPKSTTQVKEHLHVLEYEKEDVSEPKEEHAEAVVDEQESTKVSAEAAAASVKVEKAEVKKEVSLPKKRKQRKGWVLELVPVNPPAAVEVVDNGEFPQKPRRRAAAAAAAAMIAKEDSASSDDAAEVDVAKKRTSTHTKAAAKIAIEDSSYSDDANEVAVAKKPRRQARAKKAVKKSGPAAGSGEPKADVVEAPPRKKARTPAKTAVRVKAATAMRKKPVKRATATNKHVYSDESADEHVVIEEAAPPSRRLSRKRQLISYAEDDGEE